MVFTSLQYLVFFIIVCLIYFLLNKKLRIYFLLIASYYFYMCWNVKYAFLMLFSTIITYLSGLLIKKFNKHKKIFVILSFTINLAILFIFKYYSFFADSINKIISLVHLNLPESLNLLLPVGISFYTFQALSYTMDVYRGDVEVETNFFRYALFVSFFPQLVAGPIEKSKDLLKQFKEDHKFSWENLNYGLLLIGIGVFYKLVIADRSAIIINSIYNNLNNFTSGGGIYLLFATFLFAFQIYFDFNAYSLIARGSAKIMGYNLTRNFNVPYIATSVKDFWRRWHISLSSWFREYLYFPLGGNRKGFLRTQINLLIVFIVSGLWHGASWTFVIWGLLHGLYQVVANIFNKIKPKTKDKQNIIKTIIKVVIVFILVDFAWIFFRANNIKDAIFVITHLLDFGMPIDFTLMNTDLIEIFILLFTILLVYIFELINTKYDLYQFIKKRNIFIRFSFYYLLIFSIIIFGIYGPGFSLSEFIYFQF